MRRSSPATGGSRPSCAARRPLITGATAALARSAHAVLFALGLALAGIGQSAMAQEFPSRPLKLVVPFAIGGVTDVVSRIVATGLGAELGQQVVVENRAGASGISGTDVAAHSPADGYTLMMGNISTLAINSAMFAKLPYDPVKSFIPISLVSIQPLMLAVHGNLPVTSVRELVALAKAKPGTLSYGSAGSSLQLATEAFNQAAGMSMIHIPYKGDAPAITDLIAGTIQVMFDPFSSIAPFVRDGKLRGLAVTSRQRSPLAPELPTLIELGFPDVEVTSWQGIVVPAGTPAPIVAKLQTALQKVLNGKEVREQLARQGTEASPGTGEQFAAFIDQENTRWKRVARNAGLKPE